MAVRQASKEGEPIYMDMDALASVAMSISLPKRPGYRFLAITRRHNSTGAEKTTEDIAKEAGLSTIQIHYYPSARKDLREGWFEVYEMLPLIETQRTSSGEQRL